MLRPVCASLTAVCRKPGAEDKVAVLLEGNCHVGTGVIVFSNTLIQGQQSEVVNQEIAVIVGVNGSVQHHMRCRAFLLNADTLCMVRQHMRFFSIHANSLRNAEPAYLQLPFQLMLSGSTRQCSSSQPPCGMLPGGVVQPDLSR